MVPIAIHQMKQSGCLQSLGMTSSTCGVYQAEATRGPRRGKMSVIVVLHNVVFYMLGSWLTLATAYLHNDGQWRVPFALQVSLPDPYRHLESSS